jgi:hypothetical protein
MIESESSQVTIDATGNITLEGEWLYYDLVDWAQTLACKGEELKPLTSHYNENLNEKGLRRRLCKIWILAETLGDLTLQNLIMKELIESSDRYTSLETSLPRSGMIAIAEKLFYFSVLRRWAVDLISAYCDVNGMSQYPWIPSTMYFELLTKAYEKKEGDGKFQIPRMADLDKYCKVD